MQSIAWDWNGIAIKTKVACQQVWTWNISSHVGFRLFSFKLKGLAESDQMRANHKFFNRKTSILDSNKFLHSNSNFSSFWIIFHTPTFQRADGNFGLPEEFNLSNSLQCFGFDWRSCEGSSMGEALEFGELEAFLVVAFFSYLGWVFLGNSSGKSH